MEPNVNIEFSGNAWLRMRNEGLSADQVAQVVLHPDRVIRGPGVSGTTAGDTVVAEGTGDNRRVRVVYRTPQSSDNPEDLTNVVVLSALVLTDKAGISGAAEILNSPEAQRARQRLQSPEAQEAIRQLSRPEVQDALRHLNSPAVQDTLRHLHSPEMQEARRMLNSTAAQEALKKLQTPEAQETLRQLNSPAMQETRRLLNDPEMQKALEELRKNFGTWQ